MTLRRGAMVAVVTLAVLTAGMPAGARAQDKATFRLSWLISATAAPFYLGLDKGFYRAEGIDLAIEEGKGASLSARLVSQKGIDLILSAADFRKGGSAELYRRADGWRIVWAQPLRGQRPWTISDTGG